MKAITCPQCGATIENVSERSVMVDCEYCGARILMDRPALKPAVSFDSDFVPDPDFKLSTPPSSPVSFVAIIGGSLAVIPILIVLFLCVKGPTGSPSSTRYSVENSNAYSANVAIPSSWNVRAEPVKPLPVVNYQPRVSWDGPNDMEYFEDPDVDISSVSNLSSDEIKKTVFKDRTVKLRVVITTDGEIDSVETISGHPLLVDAATKSVKKSIFKQRSKSTTRVLTYTFRVLPD